MSKVIIFGAGNCGRLIATEILRNAQHEIICMLDNDTQKHDTIIEFTPNVGGGGKICIPIHSPQKIPTLTFDTIILGTFTGLDELKQQLMQDFNIPFEKIDSSYIEMSVLARIAFLQDIAAILKEKNLNGQVAELGVYRGDYARHINQCFPDKKLYLFDTFEGFHTQDISQDTPMSKTLGSKHFANTSIELVLSKMPYPRQCVIKQGWFPESAIGLEEEQFCFVNLDADLHDPILAGLQFFYPRMVQGGIILVHEYFSPGYAGVKKAVDSFLATSQACSMPIGDRLSLAILKT